MKKILVLLIVLVLLSGGSLIWTAHQVISAKDQAEIQESILHGSTDAVTGLSVRFRSQYQQRHYWDITHNLSTGEITPFHLYTEKPLEDEAVPEYDGLTLNVELHGYMSSQPDLRNPLSPAFEKTAEKMMTGETRSETIRVKDYCTYYPLTGTLSAPNTFFWDSRAYRNWSRSPEDASDTNSVAYAIDVLQEFFRIPVLENEEAIITVQKEEHAYSCNVIRFPEVCEDYYLMNSFSVLSDSDIYMTFDTHSEKGQIVDTSLIPGGYGIYRLPYLKEYTGKENSSGILVDELTMVYPLSPEIQVMDLTISPNKSSLLLHFIENGSYILTVIDADSMEQLQQINLGPWNAQYQWNYTGDDFLTIIGPGHELILLTSGENGLYSIQFRVKLPDEEENQFQLRECSSMDFDGKRLAITGYDRRDGSDCSYWTAVYEASGLTFCGEYRTSLSPSDMEDINYRKTCKPMKNTPLSVYWN